jgi:hypothetical protein
MQTSEGRPTSTTQQTTKNNPNQKNSQTHNPLEVLYKKPTTTQNKKSISQRQLLVSK